MKSKKIISTTVLILLVFVFIFSATQVVRIKSNYKESQEAYAEIKDDANKIKGNVNFNKLKKQNKDVCAWVKLNGTNIDYPIVKGKDYDTYLHTKFDGTYGAGGTLFTDYKTKPFKSNQTIVYGHHMKDGSMFNNLKYFTDQSWAKKHNTFIVTTPKFRYKAKVVAFLNVKASSEFYKCVFFNTKQDKERLVKVLIRDSKYLLDEPNENDKYITFSTCAYEFKNARYAVVCKLTDPIKLTNGGIGKLSPEQKEAQKNIRLMNMVLKIKRMHREAE